MAAPGPDAAASTLWQQPLKECLAALQTQGEGLAAADAAARLERAGPNLLRPRVERALLLQFLQEISGAAADLQDAATGLQVIKGLPMLPGFPGVVGALAGAGEFLVEFIGAHQGRQKPAKAAILAGK